MSVPPQHEHVPPVLQEIRHRRVGKVTVAYLGLAFGAMEVARLLLPLFAAPEWAGRAVLGALVMGFPTTVVLAWTYDLTPSGVVRTPDDLSGGPGDQPNARGWLVLTVLGAVTGLAIRLLRG